MAFGIDSKEKAIARAAFAAAAAGVVGLAAVQLWLRPGLPFDGGELSDRVSYLARHQTCWTWGWLLAGLGAALVVNLYRVLAARFRSSCEGSCRLAMLLATAGLGVDLSGIALWLVVAPGQDAAGLGLVEKMAGALSLFAAKILYSAAGVLLTLAGWRELSRGLIALGFGVWLSGFWVAGATLCGCGSAQFWSLGALVVLFIAWSTLLGLHFLGIRPGSGASKDTASVLDPRD
ncbi:MAG: hypothetical protein L0191_20595 [Acidobacteria bacterium]|nr:hypothetical protein [Acidobacteriota bacterium]MCI0568240.1 hypothetical protein [Acidobacteriota bacterium]